MITFIVGLIILALTAVCYYCFRQEKDLMGKAVAEMITALTVGVLLIYGISSPIFWSKKTMPDKAFLGDSSVLLEVKGHDPIVRTSSEDFESPPEKQDVWTGRNILGVVVSEEVTNVQ